MPCDNSSLGKEIDVEDLTDSPRALMFFDGGGGESFGDVSWKNSKSDKLQSGS